jgi:hypothetical protein
MKYFKLSITDYSLDTCPRAVEGMNTDEYDLSIKRYWDNFVLVGQENLKRSCETGIRILNEKLPQNSPSFFYHIRVRPKDIMEMGFSHSMLGFTVSKKVRSFFTEEELKWYSISDTNIWYRGNKQEQYSFFATILSLRHFIDFQKSEFYLIKTTMPGYVYDVSTLAVSPFETSRDVIKILDMHDFLKKSSPTISPDLSFYSTLLPKHVILRAEFKTCPIIMTHKYFITQVVNENLLERMTNNQVTGIEKVTELDWLHGDW